jgi:hypothetical protein
VFILSFFIFVVSRGVAFLFLPFFSSTSEPSLNLLFLQVEQCLAVVRSALGSGMDWGELSSLVKEEKKKNPHSVANLIHRLVLDKNTVTLLLSDPQEDFDGILFFFFLFLFLSFRFPFLSLAFPFFLLLSLSFSCFPFLSLAFPCFPLLSLAFPCFPLLSLAFPFFPLLSLSFTYAFSFILTFDRFEYVDSDEESSEEEDEEGEEDIKKDTKKAPNITRAPELVDVDIAQSGYANARRYLY